MLARVLGFSVSFECLDTNRIIVTRELTGARAALPLLRASVGSDRMGRRLQSQRRFPEHLGRRDAACCRNRTLQCDSRTRRRCGQENTLVLVNLFVLLLSQPGALRAALRPRRPNPLC